jgi:hypothetical protein
MKQRLRIRNRLSNRLRTRLRATAMVLTFGGLVAGIFFLYEFIGNVSASRAQLLEERLHPKAGVLEGYSGRKKISIHPEKLPAGKTLSNFPVLVSLRLDELRSITSGGMVSGRDGEDIVFTSIDGTSILPFQIERFEPASGKLLAWVRCETLSAQHNEFYLYYGKAEATAESSKNTFADPYRAVWHFNRGFQTDGVTALAGEYHGVKDEEGRFAAAKDFLAYDHAQAAFQPNEALSFSGDISVSAWVKSNGSTYDQTVVTNLGRKGGFSLWMDADGRPVFQIADATGKTATLKNEKGGTILEKGKWYQLCGVYSSAKDEVQLYVNGKLDRSTKAGLSYSVGDRIVIGAAPDMESSFMNGLVDELRIAAKAFDADEMATLYASESDPESFFSIDGKEVFSASPRMVKYGSMEAKENSGHVVVNWQTVSESRLDVFSLERSTDGEHFTKVASKLGAGESDQTRNYFLIDPTPAFGNVSYRIRATSFKGESDVSQWMNVHIDAPPTALGISNVEPNPFKEQFSVIYHSKSNSAIEVKLTSISGQVVHTSSIDPTNDPNNRFDFKEASSLRPGIYFLSMTQADEQKTVKLIKQL